MSKSLANEIKKNQEYRNSLVGEIKKIKKKGRILEEEKNELLKTLSEEEVLTIERERIKKSSLEAQEMLNKEKQTQKYKESEEIYKKHKEIIEKLSELMNISSQEAENVVKNLDSITKGEDQFMKKFVQSLSNILKWITPLAQKIEKTKKEKELLEEKMQKIQSKGQLSTGEREKVAAYINENEIDIINKIRSDKSEKEMKDFLKEKKEKIQKLENTYKEQQVFVKQVSELLDISENDVLNVLKYLNIKMEEQKETSKDKENKKKYPKIKNKKVSKKEKEKTPKENIVKKFLENTINNIADKKKQIILTASLVLAVLGTGYIGTKTYTNYQEKKNKERQEMMAAENKIFKIDTLTMPGIEINDTITVKEFINEIGISMDAKTLTVLPYPGETLNEYSYINDHFIKDKDQVIFYSHGFGATRIPLADPESFESLNGGFANDKYAKDKNHVYIITADIKQIDRATTKQMGYRVERLDDADPSTFTVLGGDYGKDKHNVFYKGEKMPLRVIDVESFEYVGGRAVAKDKNHVYNEGNIVHHIDTETFKCIDKEKHIFADKNGIYDRELELLE